MNQAAIETRGVSKSYGRVRSLASLDLRLGRGEGVALLGPNGAGKSTLCGILALLVRPTTGEVLIGGERTADRRQIGLCAHESLCYADLTGHENLAFFARLYGVERARVDALIERVDLTAAADRPARTYSRGMVQRLALARALLHRPSILLFDEPFTGLDRAGVALLREILGEERARGTLLVVTTHDFDAIAGLASRAVLLKRGRRIYDGPAPSDGDGLRALYHREVEGAEAAAAEARS